MLAMSDLSTTVDEPLLLSLESYEFRPDTHI